MNDTATLDKELNEQILSGKALDAFEKYYAEDVVMQENSDAPFVGKETNRKREHAFFGNIGEFHGAKMEGSAVNGDSSFSQWWMDLTLKNGERHTINQVAVRKWKDGKIVHERFFHQ